MTKSRIRYVLTLGMLAVLPVCAQQQPPRELVEYIRDARKAGLQDGNIQQNAVKAGWPADVVARAIRDGAHQPTSTAPPAAKAAPRTSFEIPSQLTPEAAAAPAAAAAATPSKVPPPATGVPAGAEPAAQKTAPLDRGVPNDYQIGAGDVLQISVWKEPDASVPSVVVRPDGRISMPMLKDVAVIGMTPAQAEVAITNQLVKFISAADVTVIVKEINSKKIYVVGGVKKEGPIPYTYRMTILQALSEAGGLSDYAKRKKIYVLRHESGRDYQLPFDYDAALRGEHMELNIPMLPGDTLVVPK